MAMSDIEKELAAIEAAIQQFSLKCSPLRNVAEIRQKCARMQAIAGGIKLLLIESTAISKTEKIDRPWLKNKYKND